MKEKEKKQWPIRECYECKKSFSPIASNQKHCLNPCRSEKRYSIEQANAEWLKRDENYYERRARKNRNNFYNGQIRCV